MATFFALELEYEWNRGISPGFTRSHCFKVQKQLQDDWTIKYNEPEGNRTKWD